MEYTYDYTSAGSTADSGALVAFLIAYFGIIFVVSVVPAILQLIGQWKTYKKMGEPGWACLVPYYNIYVVCKRCSKMIYFKMLIGGTIAMTVASLFFIAGDGAALFGALIYIATYIVLIVAVAKMYGDWSRCFGYSTGFAVGMFFIPWIFFMILGFGNCEYLGNVNDPSQNLQSQADRYAGYESAYNNYSGNRNNMNNGYQNNSYSNNMNNGYQNNSYPNNMNNGYQNNSYPNNMNNSYQNNSYSNNMNNNYQNNQYSGNMNNSYQNNGYSNNNINNSFSTQPKDMADLAVPVVDDSAFEQYERNNGRKPNNDNFMNGI